MPATRDVPKARSARTKTTKRAAPQAEAVRVVVERHAAQPKRGRYNFRFPHEAMTLVDQAAASMHKDRTEFVKDAMLRVARETLLDQTVFIISPDEYEQIMSAPTEPTEDLKAMARRVPIWDR